MKVYLVPSGHRKTANSALLRIVTEFLARHEVEVLPPGGRPDPSYIRQADAVIADGDLTTGDEGQSLSSIVRRTHKPVLALFSLDARRQLPAQLRQHPNIREIRYRALFEAGLATGMFIRRLLKNQLTPVA